MFGRKVKTRLHRLHPDDIEKPLQTAALPHTRKLCDDPVWVRNYTGKPKWVARKVIAKRGPVSYKVRVREQVQRRHIDQLKKRLVDVRVSPGNVDPSDDFLSFPSLHLHSEPLTATE